jgi:hypothetical protein
MIFIGGFTNVAAIVCEIYFRKSGLMMERDGGNRKTVI